MTRRARMVGFDRTIQYNWIDSAVEFLLKGYQRDEIWTALDPIISSVLTGKDARRKCKTVIFGVWIRTPKQLAAFRDEALTLMKSANATDRLALHWGMSTVAYPFFRDFTSALGKMLSLRDQINSEQVIRRLIEVYGDRSTVIRASERLFVTLVNWGVLNEHMEPKIFSASRNSARILTTQLEPWVAECVIRAADKRSQILPNIKRSPGFFPFQLLSSPNILLQDGRFEITRHTGSDDLVTLVHSS